MTTERRAPEPSPMLGALAPMLDAAIALVDAAEEMSGSGSALADSPGMGEIAGEAKLRSDRWDEPVIAAHSLIGIHRFASGDHLRAFVQLFRVLPVPVYAHLPVARALLDTAGHGYWLTEPGIGAEARVQRYTVLRLRSAMELRRAPQETGYREQGALIIADIEAEATARGWAVNKKHRGNEHYTIGAQQLPTSKDLIAAVLAGDDRGPGRDVHADIAAAMWWYLSGVTHGVSFALLNSVDASAVAPPGPLEPRRAALFTSSRSVITYGMALIDAYEHQIQRTARLFGTSSIAWDASTVQAMEQRRAVYAAMVAEDQS